MPVIADLAPPSPAPAPVHDPLPPGLGWCRVVPGFLSAPECRQLIAAAQARGFAGAGTDYPPSYRNNDRQVVDDPALADRLLQRLRPHVPATLQAGGEPWQLHSLNERLRLCRYGPGQAFHIHQDGVHHRSAGLRSHLTFMVYLTDGDEFEGGDTLFYDRGPGADPPHPVGRLRPRAGMLIVFDHALWHAGAEVRAGVKHIIRSDVLYQRMGHAPDTPAGPWQPAHRGYVWTLAALPGGRIASGGRDTVIRLWTAQGQCQGELQGHTRSVLGLAALADGRLASVSRDRSLRVWDLASGRCVHVDDRHDAALLSVAAVGRHGLATGSADGQVRLTTAEHRSPTAVLAGHEGWVWAVAALGPAQLASASEDGCLRIWNLDGGRCMACLEGGVPLRTLAAAPGEQMLAAGGVDGRVTLWQRAGARWLPQRSWLAHGAAVRRVRFFSADLLASAGEDGWVRLWRRADGQLVAAMRHKNFATDVLPLGRKGWLSCSYDGSLRGGPWADATTARPGLAKIAPQTDHDPAAPPR